MAQNTKQNKTKKIHIHITYKYGCIYTLCLYNHISTVNKYLIWIDFRPRFISAQVYLFYMT